MKNLLEQFEVDLDAAIQGSTNTSPITPITPEKSVTDKWGRKQTDPYYGYDKKQDKFIIGPYKGLTAAQRKEKIEQENKPVKRGSIDWSRRANLISNAILCYEKLNRYSRTKNWDEEQLQQVFIKYIFKQKVAIPEYQAMYVDILYRILFGSLKGKLANNIVEYTYWLSRNRTTAVTWDLLQSEWNSQIDSFIGWFRGKPLDWMDWDIKTVGYYFDSVFAEPVNPKQIINNPLSTKLTLKRTMSDSEIHSMIMNAYRDKVFGTPKK